MHEAAASIKCQSSGSCRGRSRGGVPPLKKRWRRVRREVLESTIQRYAMGKCGEVEGVVGLLRKKVNWETLDLSGEELSLGEIPVLEVVLESGLCRELVIGDAVLPRGGFCGRRLLAAVKDGNVVQVTGGSGTPLVEALYNVAGKNREKMMKKKKIVKQRRSGGKGELVILQDFSTAERRERVLLHKLEEDERDKVVFTITETFYNRNGVGVGLHLLRLKLRGVVGEEEGRRKRLVRKLRGERGLALCGLMSGSQDRVREIIKFDEAVSWNALMATESAGQHLTRMEERHNVKRDRAQRIHIQRCAESSRRQIVTQQSSDLVLLLSLYNTRVKKLSPTHQPLTLDQPSSPLSHNFDFLSAMFSFITPPKSPTRKII